MGQALIQLIQFLCGYFGAKLARQLGQTSSLLPPTAFIMFRYVPCVPDLCKTFIMKGVGCQNLFQYIIR